MNWWEQGMSEQMAKAYQQEIDRISNSPMVKIGIIKTGGKNKQPKKKRKK